MENPYTCDKCDWRYVWTMGDRVKAATWHQLAHLFEGRDKAEIPNQPSSVERTYRTGATNVPRS